MIASEPRALIALVHEWVHDSPEYVGAIYYVFMVLVQALPTPTAQSSAAHVWLFNVAHLLSANLGLLGKRKAAFRPEDIAERAQEERTK